MVVVDRIRCLMMSPGGFDGKFVKTTMGCSNALKYPGANGFTSTLLLVRGLA